MKLMPGIKVSENKIQCTEIKQGSKLGSKLGLNLGSQIRIEIRECRVHKTTLKFPSDYLKFLQGAQRCTGFYT